MYLNIHQKQQSGISQEKGAAFVELIIVIPFLAFLFFGATEFVRVLRIMQGMAVISKELGNGAFSDCLELETPQACLDDMISKVNNTALVTLPPSKLIVSVYKLDSAGGLTLTIARAGGLSEDTKYNAGNVHAGGTATATILDKNRAIAIGEVYTAYTPLFSTSTLGGITRFYDATIY